jgi:hypothetical protein
LSRVGLGVSLHVEVRKVLLSYGYSDKYLQEYMMKKFISALKLVGFLSIEGVGST